jgi:hypothetical protein
MPARKLFTPKINVPAEVIKSRIYLIRGHKVMLDSDLAELYAVSVRRLKEQVRRNIKRFPSDFMFELTWEEALELSSRSHFATLKKGKNIKYLPFVFTEQGVAMLSSVLNSDLAIEVNIQIMRVFTKLREMMISQRDLAHKIEAIEQKYNDHDHKIVLIFNAIKRLLKEKREVKKKGPMGFVVLKTRQSKP